MASTTSASKQAKAIKAHDADQTLAPIAETDNGIINTVEVSQDSAPAHDADHVAAPITGGDSGTPSADIPADAMAALLAQFGGQLPDYATMLTWLAQGKIKQPKAPRKSTSTKPWLDTSLTVQQRTDAYLKHRADRVMHRASSMLATVFMRDSLAGLAKAGLITKLAPDQAPDPAYPYSADDMAKTLQGYNQAIRDHMLDMVSSTSDLVPANWQDRCKWGCDPQGRIRYPVGHPLYGIPQDTDQDAD